MEKEEKTLNFEHSLSDVEGELHAVLQKILNVSNHSALTGNARMRLFGSGVKRYGFVKRTMETANANAEFAPPYLDLNTFCHLTRQLEEVRNIDVALQILVRANADLLLLLGDEMYRFALMYYNSVKDASERRVAGAREVFLTLRPFFDQKRRDKTEPTQHKVERDVRALLKGTKDGEIVVNSF
jgi:hypothetical protein